MKNQAKKAIQTLKSLFHVELLEVKAGNFKPLAGRYAKLTRLYLLNLPEAQKAKLFDRLEKANIKTVKKFLRTMEPRQLASFVHELNGWHDSRQAA